MKERFQTSRLLLRRWRPEDRLPFQRMNADLEVMRYFHSPLDTGASDAFIDRIEKEFQEKGWGLWAVEPKEGEPEAGRLVGFTGFHEATFESDFTPAVEIGWRLKRSAWGKGYATEGARFCLTEGFNTFGFDRIVSFASDLNVPSINVMRKIGLKAGPGFIHPALPEGHRLASQCLYSLSRKEFSSMREFE